MIIKKYIATTEKEAVSLAKAELGEDVTIMNIKENNPKGLSRLFKKSSVEVTAAIDDVKTESKTPERKKEHTDFAKLQQALDGNGFTPAPDSKTARMEENKERPVFLLVLYFLIITYSCRHGKLLFQCIQVPRLLPAFHCKCQSHPA